MIRRDVNSRLGMDFMSLGLMGFVVVTIILLAFIAEEKKKEADIQGDLMVEIFWEDGLRSDVDLWVVAPDGVAVGYSNAKGQIWNLLRDDRGDVRDLTNRNSEIAYSRGFVEGEYIVNVHLYSARDPLPIDVEVAVRIKKSVVRDIHYETVTLKFKSEEITAIRFTLDKDGNVVSKNKNYHKIKGA
tara:strand:- start:1082 stop:1639 length:558 start_codon:yes stop_codon:yes gene_type:complete